MVERTHIATGSAPSIKLRTVKQPNDPIPFKPSGFWYEVDGDWRRWCRSEEPGWLRDRSLYRVTLGSDVRLLGIAGAFGLREFQKQYTAADHRFTSFVTVDWKRLATEYDGIEIAPYVWSLRFAPDFSWYYGWDCASGCIWRPRNTRVEFIRKITDADLKDKEDSDGNSCPA